jgi:lipid-A-disaccharide synthase-like uncharacterized protein
MLTIWFWVGLVGSILFFGRFYWQWLVSEFRGQYTVPLSFWYMSAAGSLLLFAYAYERGSPGGTFGLCINIPIYARNIVYIYRERGWLTPVRNVLIHVIAFVVAGVAFALTVQTWHAGYELTQSFWLWSAAWAIGQCLFFGRFAWQWLETEYRGRSVISAPFWYMSLAGLVLHGAYFFHRGDMFLAIGTVVDALPYIRNIMLLRKEEQQTGDAKAPLSELEEAAVLPEGSPPKR